MMNDELKRIRWACRRGMLELDLMLEGFFDHCYQALKPEQQACFIRLLSLEDQTLFRWLTGREVADDVELAAIVKLIRENSLHA